VARGVVALAIPLVLGVPFSRAWEWSGPSPSLMSARESGVTLDCHPLSVWYLAMASWLRASHTPLGSPVRYFSRTSASWIARTRSGWIPCCPCFFHEVLRRPFLCAFDLDKVDLADDGLAGVAAFWGAAELYPAKSARAVLSKIRFLKASRKQITSKGFLQGLSPLDF